MDFDRDEMRAVIREELRGVHHKLDMHSGWLTGNGRPQDGIILRLDRLEQTEVGRKWLSRTLIGASLGAIIASIMAFIRAA